MLALGARGIQWPAKYVDKRENQATFATLKLLVLD